MADIDFTAPVWFLTCVIVIFLMVTLRYFLVAGIFFVVFYVWRPERWMHRKLNQKPYREKQFRKEVKWSVITAFIFAIVGACGVVGWQKGWIKVYLQITEYPWWWLPLSFFIAVMLHETYYYWLHRWMHHPRIFRIVHKVHHDSNITSPWTAFSFHPIEGLLQAIFLPTLLCFLPMHLYVLILQLSFMTLSSVVNHLDIEIYPPKFHKHFIGKWLIGATHHSLHHKQFRYNYGLYFTFWDKWKKTESSLYPRLFVEKTAPTKK